MLGPLFGREWQSLPRRPAHYFLRCAFWGTLLILGVTTWLATRGAIQSLTLGDTSRFGQALLQFLTCWVLLPAVLFFAALSTANAVVQEKSRQTFVLLLLTSLRNDQIVVGKLLGSLLPIGLLIVGTVPILSMLQWLGGITLQAIAESALILLAGALAAGTLGHVVALWRPHAFQSLALTALFLVLYLGLARSIDFQAMNHWFDPFAAMLAAQASPEGGSATSTCAVDFALAMLTISLLLNGYAIVCLRTWNLGRIERRQTPADDAMPAPSVSAGRRIWTNPILWREVRTHAYGRRTYTIKAAYAVAVSLICWYAFGPGMAGKPFAAAHGLVPVTVLSLVLIGAQAVTAITTERDNRTLDLLLVSDLSPREFILGKMLGIVINTKEFLLPPMVLTGVYAWLGWLATPPSASSNVAAFLGIAGILIVLPAFALVLGMHVGLRVEQSRLAISQTLGTIFFLSAGTLLTVYIIILAGRFEVQWSTFLFFVGSGIGGLYWVLTGNKPSVALTIASFLCPLAILYSVITVLIGRPGIGASAAPLFPCLFLTGSFGFAIVAMMVPLWSEFDVALGRSREAE